jgi:hypothetical protein
VVQAITGAATRSGGCVRFAPAGAPAALDVEAPAGATLVIRNEGAIPAQVRLRRFGADFGAQALGEAPPRGRVALALPGDAGSMPWTARLSPAEPVVACLAR